MGVDINRVSIHRLRERLARLRALNLDLHSVNDLEERVAIVLDQVPIFPFPIAMNGVYRARARDADKPAYSRVSELWYPPASVVGMGRLNNAGQSLFYAANTPHTAIYELRPQVGKIYTVLWARTKAKGLILATMFPGITRCRSADLLTVRTELPKRVAAHRARLGGGNWKKYALLDDWLTEIITRSATNTNDYKPTIGLANILFRAPIDAVAYPSVATGHNGINICFQPERADELFKASEAWEFEILGDGYLYDKPSLLLRSLRKSTIIDDDGIITWGAYGVDVGEYFIRQFARGLLPSLEAAAGR